jgi:hypothetical protein
MAMPGSMAPRHSRQVLSSLKYFKTPANLAVSLRVAHYKSVQTAAQCDWHMSLLWPRSMLIAAKAWLSDGVDVSDDFAVIHIDLVIATSADHFGEVVAPCVVRCFATVRQALQRSTLHMAQH